MQTLSLTQLYQSYVQLRAQLERRSISYQQFVDSVRQLQAQDAAGKWWMIDPETGRYLTHTGTSWVEATPTAGQPQEQAPATLSAAVTRPTSGAPQTPTQMPTQSQAPEKRQGGCLASPMLTGLLSFGTAFVWFAYSSLSPSHESTDILTPLLIAGTPLALRLLQKPLDKVLGPIYKVLNALPRPLLIGAALAVPLVVGGIFTQSYGSGYQALRRSTITSVLFGYILTRRPEANL